jgi:hypothetical protein
VSDADAVACRWPGLEPKRPHLALAASHRRSTSHGRRGFRTLRMLRAYWSASKMTDQRSFAASGESRRRHDPERQAEGVPREHDRTLREHLTRAPRGGSGTPLDRRRVSLPCLPPTAPTIQGPA